MLYVEKINSQHEISLSKTPNDADLAIVPINNLGTPGNLNKLVIKEYGYTENDLPKESELIYGFSSKTSKDKKAILFVVTISNNKTNENLEINLYNTLTEFRGWFRNKTVWLPLMGTGEGRLSFEESYSITARTINKFITDYLIEVKFIISLPNNKNGKEFYNFLNRTIYNSGSLESILTSYTGNYYLAGSVWENEDQTERFFENGIWENGHEEKFTDIVNSVKPGDILFLKSTYTTNGKSFLRIKGAGLVTKNHLTGTILSVDWKIKNIEINIEGLGHYRSTFARVNSNDVETILDAIGKLRIYDSGLLKPGNPAIAQYQNKSTIADLIADDDSGDDYLDIQKDILAFSKIMTSKSFKPPLAIALFGKWGSGKSFFMKKLRKQIEDLSTSDDTNVYCKGISHIHFNAWSYLDANLWASLVTKIFEGLNDYISNDTDANRFRIEIEKELSQLLNVTKEEINQLDKQKEVIKQQITILIKEKENINHEMMNNIAYIEKITLKNIIKNVDDQFSIGDKIKQALADNPTCKITEDEIKQIVPEKYWENPSAIYFHIKSKYTFLKKFFRGERIVYNLIVLSFILSLIFTIPILLPIFIDSLKNSNFIIPQIVLSIFITVGAAWKRIETVYKQLQPLITSFWNIKKDYEYQMNDALFIHAQKEKALKLHIEHSKNDLNVINQKIHQANAAKNSIENKIDNALTTEALFSFIEKRSNSDDYKKHLGIVSIIRKDFEILSSLFLESNNDTSGALFRDKFKTPLERIILYIDDLDRCPEDRVIEILEAVNLLMAFPLFIVVVGVDPRWIKNALIKKYHLQFTGRFDDNMINEELDIIEASNYLEKIFQVPFHLKEASDGSVKHMIKTLSISKILSDNDSDDDSNDLDINAETTNSIKNEKRKETDTYLEVNNKKNNTIKKPEHLVLSKNEIELMLDLSKVIGNNPRVIKRFVNVYHIVRAHEELTYMNNDDEKEYFIIMFLLALSVGPYKKLSIYFKEYISNSNNQSKKLSTFLEEDHSIDDLNELSNALNETMNEIESFVTLSSEEISTFSYHNKFIKRFTFDECS